MIKPDPVIEMLNKSELSNMLLDMQAEFKTKGSYKFSHDALKIPPKNILTLLRKELHRSEGKDEEQINQIKKIVVDVAELNDKK